MSVYRYYHSCCWGLLLFFCWMGNAQANAVETHVGSLPSSGSSDSKGPEIGWDFQLGVESYTQLPVKDLEDFSRNVVNMGAGFHYSDKRKPYDNKANLNFLYVMEKPYLDLTEIYSSMGFSNDWSASFGRQKHSWSWGDQFMGRGLWQPRFQWNKMHPKPQGLIGLFLHSPQKDKGFHWTVLLSPFSLFDVNAHFQERDGGFQSTNPWFHPPQRAVSIYGKETRIDYRLVKPSIKDVLLKSPGVATKLEWRGDNIQWGSSWAYKPMNQFHLQAPIVWNIAKIDEGDPRIEVAIHAAVEAHRVWTQELNWTQGLWNLQLDFTYDQPLIPTYPKSHLVQNLTDARVYTARLSRKWNQRKKALEFFLGHSYVDGGVAGDKGELAGGESYFEPRYVLINTTVMGVNQFLFPLRGVRSSVITAYDWDQRGIFIKSSLDIQWRPNFATYLQWDVLEPMDWGREPERGDGLISRYHKNDVVKIGVNYDF